MEAIYFFSLLVVLLIVGLLVWLLLIKMREISSELRQLRQDITKIRHSPVITSQSDPAVFITQDEFALPVQAAAPNRSLLSSEVKKQPSKRPGFFERNPDLEKFIGENLINKLGIAVLVLGIGYFVKFAIDQNWINAWGRVLIGFSCGAALLGLAHHLRKQYAAFSSVLVGGGLAVLYFTIALAFHEYQLFSQAIAFILMVAVTGFSVFMSITYDRQELAVLALLGGFASPLLASSGGNNYLVLFIYILILNIGMLILAYFKKWPVITFISYVATIILFAGWLVAKAMGEPQAPYLGGFIFAMLFYLVFFAMTVVYNLKQQQPFNFLEISILLSNTIFFYLCGLYLLNQLAVGTYLGLFSGVMAFVNGLVFWQLKQQLNDDPKLRLLLGGLGGMLLYLAILFELTYKLSSTTIEMRAIKYLIIASYHYLFAILIFRFLPAGTATRWPLREILLGLSFGSYILLVQPIVEDARNAYLLQPSGSILPFVLHYLALFLLLALLYYAFTYYRQAIGLRTKRMNNFLWFGCSALVYLVSIEADHVLALIQYKSGQNLKNLLQQQHKIYFPILWGLASFGFMLLGMRYKLKTLRLVSLSLFFITLLKLFLFDIQNISAGGRIAAFISLGVLLLIVSFLYQKLKILLLDDTPPEK
ncbi:DUF2339 domain-containing protein [Adhaeribacter radiodurans]|uniref:DUF2339 domain-containing protein n=1 Tax=Adhaeribacter radiodurans TaxID=2745197 RepID=A0A7L7L5G4_9BACT|nr:DUF2339 domain-containing protein [Adhaeribacter radiodurans]QMU28004.1 DUF2339 domain-containing protein [Adhaeribacter radiodurans]